MDKQEKQYISNLKKVFIASCNPNPRQFYGSLMLNNGGKLIIRAPKNLDTVVKSDSSFQEIVD